VIRLRFVHVHMCHLRQVMRDRDLFGVFVERSSCTNHRSLKTFYHNLPPTYLSLFPIPGVHNFFAIAGCVTLIFTNYDRQRDKGISIFLHFFCSASTHWAYPASTCFFGRLSTKYHSWIKQTVYINARPP